MISPSDVLQLFRRERVNLGGGIEFFYGEDLEPIVPYRNKIFLMLLGEDRFQSIFFYIRIGRTAGRADTIFVGVLGPGQWLFARLAAGAGLPAQPFRLTGRLGNGDPPSEGVDVFRISFEAGGCDKQCAKHGERE